MAFLPDAVRLYAVTAITGCLTPVVSGALIMFLLSPVQTAQGDLKNSQNEMLVKQGAMETKLDEVHLLVNSSFSKVQRDLTAALDERAALLSKNAALSAQIVDEQNGKRAT